MNVRFLSRTTTALAALALGALLGALPALAGGGDAAEYRGAAAVGAADEDRVTQVRGGEYVYYCRPGSGIKYRKRVPEGEEFNPARVAGVRPAKRHGTCVTY